MSEDTDTNTRRVIDLSLPIHNGMPVVPGTGRDIEIERTATFESEYNRTTSRLALHSHLCGTHIDAPLHAIPGGEGIDAFPLGRRLMGVARVLDLRHVGRGHCVTVDDLEGAVAKSGEKLQADEMLLINTGWTDREWGRPTFFDEMVWFDSPAVGEWLAGHDPRAVVTDSYNDNWGKFFEPDWWRNHRPLLSKGIPLIEFCCNMDKLYGGSWEVVALPLKITGCDAAPARVVAIEQVH